MCRNITGRCTSDWSQPIEEGISAGEFRRVDTRNTALTVVSIMVFYFAAAPVLSRILGHDPLRPREVAERRTRRPGFS